MIAVGHGSFYPSGIKVFFFLFDFEMWTTLEGEAYEAFIDRVVSIKEATEDLGSIPNGHLWGKSLTVKWGCCGPSSSILESEN